MICAAFFSAAQVLLGWRNIMENEKLDLKRLITHRLDFSQLMEGLMLMRDNSIYSNKVMLVDHE